MKAAFSHWTSSEPILGTVWGGLGFACITTFRYWQKIKSYGSPSPFDKDNLKKTRCLWNQFFCQIVEIPPCINAPSKQVQGPVRNQFNPSNFKSVFKGFDFVITVAPLDVITQTGMRWMTPYNLNQTPDSHAGGCRLLVSFGQRVKCWRRHPDKRKPKKVIQHCSQESLLGPQ